jgi:hypothetical protein
VGAYAFEDLDVIQDGLVAPGLELRDVVEMAVTRVERALG